MFLLGLGGTLVWQLVSPDQADERSPNPEEVTPDSAN